MMRCDAMYQKRVKYMAIEVGFVPAPLLNGSLWFLFLLPVELAFGSKCPKWQWRNCNLSQNRALCATLVRSLVLLEFISQTWAIVHTYIVRTVATSHDLDELQIKHGGYFCG